MSSKKNDLKGKGLPLEGQKKSSSKSKQKAAVVEDLLDFTSGSSSTDPNADSSALKHSSDSPITGGTSNQSKDSLSLDTSTAELAQNTRYHDDPEMLENTRFSKGTKPYSDQELAIDLSEHLDSSKSSSLDNIDENTEEPLTENYEDDLEEDRSPGNYQDVEGDINEEHHRYEPNLFEAGDISPHALAKRQRIRFLMYILFGFIFIIGFNLVFLPRTSLDRDLRRLHGSILTSEDIKREFLSYCEQSNDNGFLKEFSKNYTTNKIHFAGLDNSDFEFAKYTKSLFQDYGLKTSIEKYEVYVNTPVDVQVKLLNVSSEKEEETGEYPVVYDACLYEDGFNSSILEKAFHGYSANGTLIGNYFYANYGTLEDFQLLVLNGVDIENKIAIIRYGKIFRGLKVKFAEQFGCSGVLMYSDPFEDGEITESNGYKPYPEGPARNPSSFQRGSVGYFTDLPGDPTTPGYAGTSKNVKRIDPKGINVPSIPSIPMSYKSILPILKTLNGKGISLGWEGALDEFDYCTGPNDFHNSGGEDLMLNLINIQDYNIKPIYNVIGEIGGILTGEEIIIANHRDSWIKGGAGDPHSGTAVMFEIIRNYAKLLKLGWRPLRTIRFISWDGEEYGMLGSTEFGENHSNYISKNTVAYLNLDVAVAGTYFGISANPLLNQIIKKSATESFLHNAKSDSADDSTDKVISLYDYWMNQNNATISPVGAGSDFSVFQNHLGIPIVEAGFVPNTNTDPVYHYHSNYDSFNWMDKFGDSEDFKYHKCMSEFFGVLLLNLVENEIISFTLADYISEIRTYFLRFKNILPDSWMDKFIPETAEFADFIYQRRDNSYIDHKSDDEVIYYYSDVIKALSEKNIDSLKFGDIVQYLDTSLVNLKSVTKCYDSELRDLNESIHLDYPWFKLYKKISILWKVKLQNLKLKSLDKIFLFNGGLNKRFWMKHLIYAPHELSGYSSEVLPIMNEALRAGDYDETLRALVIVVGKIQKFNSHL
ncbi:hypothetical protein B5S31_g993 [[Candida] boidinii]|nr:hypothetical protein B5S31_g993 [[Candida] boidinii]